MYVCIDQNCGVTTGGEEANVSLLFCAWREESERERGREGEEASLWTDIFFLWRRKRRGREREGGEDKVKVI